MPRAPSLGRGGNRRGPQFPPSRWESDPRGGPAPAPAQPTLAPLPCSASPLDATCGRDFRPPKFNSPGGSRKPSAGAGRAVAPGVPRLRGEVPEGRGAAGCRPPRPCTLPNPARLPAAPGAGRRSPSPARPGSSATTDSCRAGARQRVWRGSVREPRARVAHLRLRQSSARPEKWPGQLRWVGWWRLWAVCCPPESLPFLHRPSPLL